MNQSYDQIVSHYLHSLFVSCKFNITEASRISGISRANLYLKLEKYEMRKWYDQRKQSFKKPKKIKCANGYCKKEAVGDSAYCLKCRIALEGK